MHRELISTLHVVNIVFQAIFNLLWQIGLMLFLAYLSVRYLDWPQWVYAPFVVFGALTGIYSMIKFILSASKSLENLEKEHKAARKAEKKGITEKNKSNE